MQNDIQKAMATFLAEVKLIDGAEGAVLELSSEAENCMILSGSIYGKDTNEKINSLGKKYGLLVLASELTVLYEKPE